ncbi:hypothetical protein CRYUN_Cryun13aG0160200 [Craigia yunnanensis]
MALLALQCISLNTKDREGCHPLFKLEALQQYKDMAVSCGQWSLSSKSTKNGVSVSAATFRAEGRGGVYKKSTSATPNRKA